MKKFIVGFTILIVAILSAIFLFQNDIDWETLKSSIQSKKERHKLTDIDDNIDKIESAETEYNTGVIYYDSGNYMKAIEHFQKSAEQGNPKAQFKLGMMYNNGKGFQQDYTKGSEWIMKAANQNFADAQYILGLSYGILEKESPQNRQKAIEWYTKASNQNHSEAQLILGRMYANGNGVSQDLSKAKDLFMKAAIGDNAEAQYYLGTMYLSGTGVDKNNPKAFKWFEKAANQNNADAQLMLGRMYSDGNGVSQDLSKAGDLFKKAASGDNSNAQYILGMTHITYTELPEFDEIKGIKLLTKATIQGHKEAKKELEKLNNEDAKAILGAINLKENGTLEEKEKAIYFLQKVLSE